MLLLEVTPMADRTLDTTRAAGLLALNAASERSSMAPFMVMDVISAANARQMSLPPDAPHVIQKNLSMLSALGVAPGEVALPLEPNPLAATREAIAAAGGSRQYIVLNPGAAWPNKRWPPERFGALAAALRDQAGLRSLVTWGPAERDLAEAVVQASSGAATAAPPTSVSDLAVLMREAALAVSGDTGPLHIAAAMGTPLVGLYGPTWPERNGPWDPDDEVISRAGVCVCHHKRRCRRGAPCIDEIAVEDVVAAAVRRLGKVPR